MFQIYIKASKDLILPYGYTKLVFIYIKSVLEVLEAKVRDIYYQCLNELKPELSDFSHFRLSLHKFVGKRDLQPEISKFNAWNLRILALFDINVVVVAY